MAKLDEQTMNLMEKELTEEVKGMKTRKRVSLLSCYANYLLDYQDPQKGEKEHINPNRYLV